MNGLESCIDALNHQELHRVQLPAALSQQASLSIRRMLEFSSALREFQAFSSTYNTLNILSDQFIPWIRQHDHFASLLNC